ncbi:amidase [Arthrobacter phage Sporto]|nr:amidase [Arthrobacter phage Sporto]
MTVEVDDFLAHYGVKGMRWGHRKSEEEVTERREAKAQKFVNKAAAFQTRIDELEKSGMSKYAVGIRTDELKKERDRALSDADAKRQGKMTSTQKKVVIGASITAGLLATYLVQDTIQSGEATRLIAKGKEHFTGEEFKFKKNEKLADRNMSVDDIHERVVKHVNPDYGKPGTKMNCRRATFAYEMRRRGYDVKATKTTNGNGQHGLGLHNAINPNEKFKSTRRTSVIKTAFSEIKDKDKGGPTPFTDLTKDFAPGGRNSIKGGGNQAIFNRLAKEPEGSRGELGVVWSMGGGHSMAYEIIKGKPVIFDAQSGKKFEDPEAFYKTLGGTKDAGFTRLDNIELNHDYLMRWMTNAK